MASTSPSVPQSAPSSPHNVQRRPRILVGVTGSVAAVKVPEITLRLVRELKAQVKILLSSAGRHFWEKAADYDDHKGTDYWDQLKPLLVTEGTMKENDCKCNNDDRVQVICKLNERYELVLLFETQRLCLPPYFDALDSGRS